MTGPGIQGQPVHGNKSPRRVYGLPARGVPLLHSMPNQSPFMTVEQALRRELAEERSRNERLEREAFLRSWESNPDRQGGYTPPNEIRDSWDQWGH